ncbi:MAG: 4-alpha-glucanotransferase [Lachnospiraceae bacterium]
MKQTRFSGILVHPTSFPSSYGIGDLGKSAYHFIYFLEKAGQTLWQVLPLGHTGYGDSPYQAFSAFAGQPLLIDPDNLIENGWLTREDVADCPAFQTDYVEYGYVIPYKTKLLKKAATNFFAKATPSQLAEFHAFVEANTDWLPDYALFMAGKDYHKGVCWLDWDTELRDPDADIKAAWTEKLKESVHYYEFIQFIFFQQWESLREYAHLHHVRIVGDIPIFVSLDSADVWANRELFQLDSKGYPTVVAGVPPDYFSKTGQLWGNPLYDWDYHKSTGFEWWIRRVSSQLKLVDYLRIDHFRGFEAYYTIPYGSDNAIKGKWKKGPGADLFIAIQQELGEDIPIWAEDLGIITPEVEELRDRFHFPGMKVLQFAFTDLKDNDLMPHHFPSTNCICYTGTHDNDTTVGWYLSGATERMRDRVRRFMNTDGANIHFDFIRTAMSSIAAYSIFPIQDLLGFGSDCRMNTPSVAAGNWQFRFRPYYLSDGLAKYLFSLTELYGRLSPTVVAQLNAQIPKEEEADFGVDTIEIEEDEEETSTITTKEETL